MNNGRFLVTGVRGGLGGEVERRLQAGGAFVFGMLRDDKRPTPWVREDVPVYSIDMATATPSQVAEAVKAMQELAGAPFDGIVHCAGAEVVSPLAGHSDAQYASAMACLTGAFGILSAAASGAVVKGGSIVLMSSVAAHRGVAGMTAYCAGKAAIEGLTRAAAMELKRKQIRVNAVAAGAFRSPMHDRITRGMSEQGQAEYAAKHPLGIGALQHVADAVLHLLTGAHWQTGSVVVVDGGYLAG